MTNAYVNYFYWDGQWLPRRANPNFYIILLNLLHFTDLTTRPPLWSSGQSSWLQIQRSGFNFRRYQIFWEIVGLERGPLSLVSTTEKLTGRKCSGSGLENLEYGRRDPSRWPRGTLYPQKLALTSPTSGERSVGKVHSRTQATELHGEVRYQTSWSRSPN
jgi:hypothetical protein